VTTLALAGAGWVAAVHGMAARAVDGVEVVRVGSRTRAAAARRAAQAGGVPCTLDDLPGDADAVVVATPAAAHPREAARAVDAGAAVLVETPLAATLAGADEIVALARRGRVAYAENLVHSPVVAEAVQACRRMGGTTHLEVRFAQGRPEAGSPRLDAAWGGGVLFDLGVHAIAVALLLAAPDRVTSVVEAKLSAGAGGSAKRGAGGDNADADDDTDDDTDDGADDVPEEEPGDGEVDEDAVVVLGFDSGLRAEVRASWRAAAPTWDAQAASPTSAVRLELVPEPSVELNGVPLRLDPPPDGLPTDQLHHLGYTGQFAALADALPGGERLRPRAEFGRLVLDVVCAAYAAAGSGGAEAVPFAGDRNLTPHQLWRGA
jgi:predicted dehydrogenase